MADYTESLGLELITPGTQAGLWGTTTNNNLNNVDQAISGITPISFAGLGGTTRTLTSNNGAADEARSAVLNITGTATAGNTIIIPNKQKLYVVRNDTGQSITFKTLTGTVTYVVQAGYYTMVFCNGNDEVYTGLLVPGATTLGVNGGGTGVTTFGTGGILRSAGGTTNLFAFPTISLNTEVAGTLPVGNGGTGQTSFTSGALLTGNGSGGLGNVPVGTAGQGLVSTGSAWAATNTVNTISAGTGIAITGSAGNFTISSSGSTAGVTSIAGSNIGVSPASGNVTITLSSGNVVSALGYTPYNSSNPSGYLTSSTGLTTNTTQSSITGSKGFAGSSIGDQKVTVSGAGFSSGMSPQGVQIGTSGYGLIASNSTSMSMLAGGGFVSDFRNTGNFQSNNSPNWATSSDINIKTNLRPISSVLDKINALNPCHFEYKDKIGKTQTGFIAQEFANVFPGHTLKTTVDNKYKEFMPEGVTELMAIDMNLTAYLVKAIQELSAKVDAQAVEIAALKGA